MMSLRSPKLGCRCIVRLRLIVIIVVLQIVPDEGVCIEKYSHFRALGRVALREGGKTVAVGIVTRILDTK